MIEKKIKKINYTSLMAKEACEAPIRIENQLIKNENLIKKIVKQIEIFNPSSVMFVGRGSSDHAGSFAKYLIEIEINIPTFSAAPSVATVYAKKLKFNNTLVIIISQSGRSPDILEQAKRAKQSGGLCISFVNDENSPLSKIVDHVIPLMVGEEKSVAATKSYLGTLSAILQLVAYWKNDIELIKAVNEIPQALTRAINAKQQLTKEHLTKVNNLVVLGRGFGFAISKEIALKLKEVCAIHAESFSSAEFLHGPVTLVQNQLKIINVQVNDESQSAHDSQMKDINSRGAKTCILHQVTKLLHPRIAALAVIQRFYLDIEKIAIEKGLNPDQPTGLKKVTETL
jgi:glucosamine--fructose-6-phosphate aminotransferase (isomerizing)